jgi:hypothetical protein
MEQIQQSPAEQLQMQQLQIQQLQIQQLQMQQQQIQQLQQLQLSEQEPPTEQEQVQVQEPPIEQEQVQVKVINCNESNDVITTDEFNEIELCCKKQNHIQETDSLQSIIKTDEDTLVSLGITFEQLEDFFEKIKFHFAHYANKDEKPNVTLSEEEKNLINSFKIGGSGWCGWGNSCCELFGNFVVFRVVWGGAETCPFQSKLDKRYHGYEYGDRDWIFLNRNTLKAIHIGDLLFHQITKHHFFQSPTSTYRVDPTTLINFFSLAPGVSYKTDISTKQKWSTGSSGWGGSEEYTISNLYGINQSEFSVTYIEKNIIGYNETKAFLVCNDSSILPDLIDGVEYDTSMFKKNRGYAQLTKRLFSEITMAELENWNTLERK